MTEPLDLTAECSLLLAASEILDAMDYARYHGGGNGRAANRRWAEVRRVSDAIAKWRREQGLGVSSARTNERECQRRSDARRIARRIAGEP